MINQIYFQNVFGDTPAREDNLFSVLYDLRNIKSHIRCFGQLLLGTLQIFHKLAHVSGEVPKNKQKVRSETPVFLLGWLASIMLLAMMLNFRTGTSLIFVEEWFNECLIDETKWWTFFFSFCCNKCLRICTYVPMSLTSKN